MRTSLSHTWVRATTLTIRLRSYVVLVSGFYYAPNRADEDEIEVFLRPLQQAFTGAVSLFTPH